jgi:hypothetical protein
LFNQDNPDYWGDQSDPFREEFYLVPHDEVLWERAEQVRQDNLDALRHFVELATWEALDNPDLLKGLLSLLWLWDAIDPRWLTEASFMGIGDVRDLVDSQPLMIFNCDTRGTPDDDLRCPAGDSHGDRAGGLGELHPERARHSPDLELREVEASQLRDDLGGTAPELYLPRDGGFQRDYRPLLERLQHHDVPGAILDGSLTGEGREHERTNRYPEAQRVLRNRS